MCGGRMNKVIFDWDANTLKILNTGQYTTRNKQYLEQLNLIKFLIEMGKDKKEIFEIWKKTDSILLQKIADDVDELDFVFNKLYLSARSWKIVRGYPINIYKSEINYINSLDVLPWIKEYLLALLCVYKYYGKPWCKYSEEVRRFCFSVTYYGREREKMKTYLAECVNKYMPYRMYTSENGVYYKCNFAVEEGDLLVQIQEPRQVQLLFGYIENMHTCQQCNEKFIYNSRTYHNTLCPSCVKKNRYKKQYECHQRQQASVKNS